MIGKLLRKLVPPLVVKWRFMNPVSTLCLHKHQDKHQDNDSVSGQQWFSASQVPKRFQFAIHNLWTTQYQTGSSVDFVLKSPLNCHAYSNQKYLVAGKQSLHIGSLFTKYPQHSLNQKQSGVSDSKSTSFAPKAILSAMLSQDRISRVPRNWVDLNAERQRLRRCHPFKHICCELWPELRFMVLLISRPSLPS